MKYNFYIVLGKKLKKKSVMTTALKQRLDKCIDLYKKNDVIMVCGGNIAKEKHTEAYMMKKYLIDVGNIPRKSIISENKSISTIENIENAHKIISTMNIKEFSIISSKSHISRVRKIVHNLKLDMLYLISYVKA